MKIEVGDKDTAEDIIEHGVGLIARGLFRLAALEGPGAAAREASAVLDHVRGCWMDLMRQAAKAGEKPWDLAERAAQGETNL